MATSNNNTLPTVQKFNSQDYNIVISIIRITKDSDIPKDTLILPNMYIKQITITNDLVHPLPNIDVLFDDPGIKEIPKYKADGYTFLRVYMQTKIDSNSNKKTVEATPVNSGKTPKQSIDGNSVEFIHDFIIKGFELKSRDASADNAVYNIYGTSSWEPVWRSNVRYSTGPDNQIPSTEILYNILKEANYPTEDPSSYNMTHTSLKYNYITPTDSKLKDSVNYLLKISSSDSGLYYFRHSLIKDEGKIISMVDLFKNSTLQYWNYISIPDKMAHDEPSYSASELLSDTPLGGTDLYDNIRPFSLIFFDRSKRKWETTEYNFDKIQSFFPSLGETNDKYQPIIKEIPDMYNRKGTYKEELLITRFAVSEKMNKLNLYTDNIQFKCLGNLNREVGELMFINTSGGVIENRYRGVWMVTKIQHFFESGVYVNDIVCCRTDEMLQIYQPEYWKNEKDKK